MGESRFFLNYHNQSFISNNGLAPYGKGQAYIVIDPSSRSVIAYATRNGKPTERVLGEGTVRSITASSPNAPNIEIVVGEHSYVGWRTSTDGYACQPKARAPML